MIHSLHGGGHLVFLVAGSENKTVSNGQKTEISSHVIPISVGPPAAEHVSKTIRADGRS